MDFIFYKKYNFDVVLTKTGIKESRNEKETRMDQKIILRDILSGYSQFKITLF